MISASSNGSLSGPVSELGQSLPKCVIREMSALPLTATEQRTSWHVRKVPIVLQNSQSAVQLIFREKTKQAVIVDRYSLKFSTEVADGFGAR